MRHDGNHQRELVLNMLRWLELVRGKMVDPATSQKPFKGMSPEAHQPSARPWGRLC